MTREQIITALWQYSGCPETETGEDFADEADITFEKNTRKKGKSMVP